MLVRDYLISKGDLMIMVARTALFVVGFCVVSVSRADSQSSINISSRDPITDARVYVSPTDSVDIVISGQWGVWGDGRRSGAAGDPGAPAGGDCKGGLCTFMGFGPSGSHYPAPGHAEGAVVIFVGNKLVHVVTMTDKVSDTPNLATHEPDFKVHLDKGIQGELGFSPNDDDLGDNVGSMRAEVTVHGQVVPKPDTPAPQLSNCSIPAGTYDACPQGLLRAPTDPGCGKVCALGYTANCRKPVCDASGWHSSVCTCNQNSLAKK